MKPRSSTVLVSSFLLAIFANAAPTHAEVVTLVCQADKGPNTWTFQVDYATGLFTELAPSGKAYTNRIVTATISPNAIIWSLDQPSSYRTADGVTHQTTEHWEGHINRLSGTGWVKSYDRGLWYASPDDFACQPVTKPKF